VSAAVAPAAVVAAATTLNILLRLLFLFNNLAPAAVVAAATTLNILLRLLFGIQ
jgi:hypothetical protein